MVQTVFEAHYIPEKKIHSSASLKYGIGLSMHNLHCTTQSGCWPSTAKHLQQTHYARRPRTGCIRCIRCIRRMTGIRTGQNRLENSNRSDLEATKRPVRSESYARAYGINYSTAAAVGLCSGNSCLFYLDELGCSLKQLQATSSSSNLATQKVASTRTKVLVHTHS